MAALFIIRGIKCKGAETMSKELSIPRQKVVTEVENEQVVEDTVDNEVETVDEKVLTPEESSYIQKVFFEEDEVIYLRDGKKYHIPPLSLRDGVKLMNKLNEIDSSIIIMNLIDDGNGETKFDLLMEVLHMAFKPYYKDITIDYLAEFIDINTAKTILDIMIGLNQIKKNL